MSEQLQLVRHEPEALIAEAKGRWKPVRTFCMFSGGNDSLVVAHRLQEHYDELFYIDTGTAVEEGGGLSVIAHVNRMALFLGKPLTVIRAEDAYARMVLGGAPITRGPGAGESARPLGFPGAGQHGRAYTRLKERQIEELIRRVKVGKRRTDGVLLVSGIHRAESRRRSKRMPLTERYSSKFVSPLIDWTPQEFARYRLQEDLPQSDVAALLHRSGECNCGAFATAEEERPMLSGLFPRTWSYIAGLEGEAVAKSRWCRWGGYDLDGVRSTEACDEQVGPICDGCDRQLDLGFAA